MKRIIEITASYTGTISTGQWENLKPFFALKETLEYDPDSQELPDIKVIERQNELQKINEDAFARQAERAYQEKIAKTYQQIRFYDVGEKKYPSVTSIINLDEMFKIPPDRLSQYASRGTIIHKQIEIYLLTGEWKEPKDIPEIYPDLQTVINGDLGLELFGEGFINFFKDYPFKVLACENTVINDDHKYAGTLDILCKIEKEKGKWNKVDGVLYDVPTVCDIKTGSIDKTKCFKQLTAYSKALSGVKQMIVIPINDSTQQGFSKPILETNMDKYWSLFRKDREKFYKRYAI